MFFILILIVALLVVGPKKLPDLARSLGRALHEVKSMTEDVKQTFVGDLDLDANLDKIGEEDHKNPGDKPGEQKKDAAPADAGTSDASTGKKHSDPYEDLKG
jgi:Tat protein translocase TatB subunit